jgi:hypothetical protein
MNALADWVRGTRDTLTWLDTDRYVWSVFAGRPDRWYDDPATLAGATAQAHSLLRSDVHPVNVAGPFLRYLAASDTAAICAALEHPEPRRLLTDTLDSLTHQLGEGVDIVLDCPSPRKLFGTGAGEVDFDAQEDVAAGLLEVIRTVADRPVGGLQIACATLSGPDDDETDCWSSLLSAAEYYGWVTAVRVNEVSNPDQLTTELPADLLLFPRVAADVLPDERRFGAGLPPEVWTDGSDAALLVDAAAKRAFRFGEIPWQAHPETVLSRVAALA